MTNLTNPPEDFYIRPNSRNIFYFSTDAIGGATKAYSTIYFSSTPMGGTDYVALDGDYIEVNGFKFFFRLNPTFNDIPLGLTRLEVIKKVYDIISSNINLKNYYNFSIIDDTGGYNHLLIIAKKESSVLNSTVNTTAANIFIENSAGSSGFFGGDNNNYKSKVKLYVYNDRNKRNTDSRINFDPAEDYTTYELESFWSYSKDTGVEILMTFEINDLLQFTLKPTNPFLDKIQICENSICKYFIEYGDNIDGKDQGTFGKLQPQNQYAFFGKNIKALKEPSVEWVDFERYWKRVEFTVPSFMVSSVAILTNLINPTVNRLQRVWISFFCTFNRFDLSTPPATPHSVNLKIKYDVYFINGTSATNNVINPTKDVNFFGQVLAEISPNMLPIATLEATSGSLIDYIVFKVFESSESYPERQLTNDWSYKINNVIKNDNNFTDLCQLTWLNSLGGYDSQMVYGSYSVINSNKTEIYDSNIDELEGVNQGVLFSLYETSYSVVLEPIQLKNNLIAITELLESSFIYLTINNENKRVYLSSENKIQVSRIQTNSSIILNLKELVNKNNI